MVQEIEKHQPTNTSADAATPGDGIILTATAVAEIRRRLDEQPEGKDHMLRLRVAAGGCSGLSYEMEFVSTRDAKDSEFVFDGLTVLVDSRSLLYISGMTLDYSSQMVNGGFQFSNPMAKRSCGCGTSFSV